MKLKYNTLEQVKKCEKTNDSEVTQFDFYTDIYVTFPNISKHEQQRREHTVPY